LWITNVLTYVFITLFALLVDPQTGRRVWREAILFPGVVSLIVMLTAVIPVPLRYLTYHALSLTGASGLRHDGAGFELFIYSWLAGSMLVAYLAKVAENHLPHRAGAFLGGALVYLAGYGSLLCAVSVAAYVKELRHAEASWDKTEKTGKVAVSA